MRAVQTIIVIWSAVMLGERIREIRKIRKMTLNDLATLAGVTASYISQLERNIIDPSISSLRKISAVLEVPIYTFLDEEDRQPVLIKAEKRRKLELPNSSIIYEFLTPTTFGSSMSPKMEIIYFQLHAESWSSEESLYHKAEECIFVIKGVMKVHLGDDSYDLNEGDSIYIRENVPHRMYNPGNKKTIGISCITPAIY